MTRHVTNQIIPWNFSYFCDALFRHLFYEQVVLEQIKVIIMTMRTKLPTLQLVTSVQQIWSRTQGTTWTHTHRHSETQMQMVSSQTAYCQNGSHSIRSK